MPRGYAGRPLVWSGSLCVRMIAFTGFDVTLAMAANWLLAVGTNICVSITMRPVSPTMKPVLLIPPEIQ